MKAIIYKAVIFFILYTVICGVAYTLFITGLAQLIFPIQANGSILEVDKKSYGSSLIGQSFTKSIYLWGRPVNVDVTTYKDASGKPLAYATPSNLSPASEEYAQIIKLRVEEIQVAHPEKQDTPVPVELVTGSASGLDPHVSPAAAAYQVERLARENSISIQTVEKIIEKCTNGRFLGVFGEETVNVLKVNLMLDDILQ